MNDKDLEEFGRSVTAHALAQQAKIDALNFLVERLFVLQGAEAGAFRDDLKKLTAHLLQKYLEQIEGQAPSLAAGLITKVPPQTEIDQSFLDKLKMQGWKR